MQLSFLNKKNAPFTGKRTTIYILFIMQLIIDQNIGVKMLLDYKSTAVIIGDKHSFKSIKKTNLSPPKCVK